MGGNRQPGLEVLSDAEAVGARVADVVRSVLESCATPVLGLATGATFDPVYRHLREGHRAGTVSFAQATSFNLDEYIGLDPEHPSSFHAQMRRALFDHVDMRRDRANIPNGATTDVAGEASRYEAAIKASGGIALQLLGIGRNGHVGFNEPGSEATSRTRGVLLSPSTREANRPNFAGGDVPERAITMGIGTIMEARHLVLVAIGRNKRAALTAALNGPIAPSCPASALRQHAHLHIIADREAAPLALAA